MEPNEIKRFLREKRKDKTNISISLDRSKIQSLKGVAEFHDLPFSAIVEICVEIGLADPFLNPDDKTKKEEDTNTI